jgi:molybdopterin molybdotransferase
MLDFESARALLLSRLSPLTTETIAVTDADRRVLAEDVSAPFDMPSFSASAMDGYALGRLTLAETGPYELEIRGESRAGQPATPLVLGSVQRISTGAELPNGADCVVPQELVTVAAGRIRFESRPRAFEHVRRRGEDLQQGELGLGRGTRLHPAALGLLGALDRDRVEVTRRPRVRIVCTGDELRAPGSAARSGAIPDSISAALAALARRAGALVHAPRFVGDDREATALAIREGLEGTDLLLTVGGVSVGTHDWVRPALGAQGVELEFWKVAIKPGKPLAFGRAPAGPWVLALPGNPASALITFALFGVPLLRTLQADSAPLPSLFRLPLGAPVRHKAGRLEFVRARLDLSNDTACVVPLDNQASGALTSLARADALLHIPAEFDDLAPGTRVEFMSWNDI